MENKLNNNNKDSCHTSRFLLLIQHISTYITKSCNRLIMTCREIAIDLINTKGTKSSQTLVFNSFKNSYLIRIYLIPKRQWKSKTVKGFIHQVQVKGLLRKSLEA